MGMFDYVICRKDLLPGRPPAFVKEEGHQFQTKDLACTLSAYEIRDGGLWEGGERESGTFSLTFYDNNICASYGQFRFTLGGEGWESVEYVAEFVDGALESIVEVERESGKALPVAELHSEKKKLSEPVIDRSEPGIGARMFLQWGGGTVGYHVTLVAKTKRKWAFVTEGDDIEVLDPRDLGHLLFHSQADSERMRASREDERRQEFEYYDRLLNAAAPAAV